MSPPRRGEARRGGGQGTEQTERRDGYRGSSAIIGAESRFFSTTDIDLGEAVRIRGTSIPCDSHRRPAARCITAHRASRGTSATGSEGRGARGEGGEGEGEESRLEGPPTPRPPLRRNSPYHATPCPPPRALSNPFHARATDITSSLLRLHSPLSFPPTTRPFRLSFSGLGCVLSSCSVTAAAATTATASAVTTTIAVTTTLLSVRQGRTLHFAAPAFHHRFLNRSRKIGNRGKLYLYLTTGGRNRSTDVRFARFRSARGKLLVPV